MSNDPIEHIVNSGRLLACLVRSEFVPNRTTFVTTPDVTQQVGFIVYGAGEEIGRHRHRPVCREIEGTGEVLVVRSGRCLIDLYDEHGVVVASRELRVGDVLIMISGGHGFRMLDDTVLLEVKQGPYVGIDEKERF